MKTNFSVENLLLILEILDINPVPVKWLLSRSLAKDVNDFKKINPQVFNNALQGNLKNLKLSNIHVLYLLISQ